MINYQNSTFLLSVANLNQLPLDEGIEIAIIGRSNTGKSSILNKLTQNKNLARVSKTPGRTQLLNYFMVDNIFRLVDLPGYGYAKVPLSVKQKWQGLIDRYLHSRQSLKGLILVMDIRHPLKELDKQMLQWCHSFDLPVLILLNKCDQLNKNEINQTVSAVKKELAMYQNPVTFQLFSALKNIGTEELQQQINQWINS